MRSLFLTAVIVMLLGAGCSTATDPELATFGRLLLVSGLVLSCLVVLIDWGKPVIAHPYNFVIPGPPAVKGSTWSFIDRGGHLRTQTDCRNGKAWAESVAWRALAAGVKPIPKGTGVAVVVVYEFAPPQRHVRDEPCVRPDVDKLARALLDALSGVAYEDDGQVVKLTVRKRYGEKTLTRVFIDQA